MVIRSRFFFDVIPNIGVVGPATPPPFSVEAPLGVLESGTYELQILGSYQGLSMAPVNVTFGVQARPTPVPIGKVLALVLPLALLIFGLLAIHRGSVS
ncbi:MAG: hypothetical protein AAGJ52_01805 [Pseudomonadota bacterium]